MKKATKLLTLVVTIITIFMAMTVVSFAGSYEYESNDSYNTADTLSANGSIRGSMGGSYEHDYYKVVAPSNGKLTIGFNHTYASSSGSWYVEVYRYASGEYTEMYSYRVYQDDNESISFPTIGAVANGVYYVYVYNNGSSAVVGKEYTVTSSFTSTSTFEKEFNDSYSTATTISTNTRYSGVMLRSYEHDYYKLKSPLNGKIYFDFNHTYTDVSGSWYVEVYKYANGEYTEMLSYRVYQEDNAKITLGYIQARTNDIYYIYVYNNGSSNVVGKEYSVAARMGSDMNNDGSVNSGDTGVYELNGEWRYVVEGFPNYSYTGVVKSQSGSWLYVKNGKVDFSKNGIVKSDSGSYLYIKNGRVDFTKTGIVKSDTSGSYLYVKNGRVDFKKTGIVKSDSGSYLYVKNGRVDFNKTGVVKSDSGSWLYVKNGRVDFKKNGLVKSDSGSWLYIKNGRVDFSKTGLVKHTNGVWYYVQNGRINFSKTGLVKHTNGVWYYVQGGQIKWSKTGLVKHTDGKLYYVDDGRINWNYTGYAYYNGKRYRVVKGKV